jgi:PTH1 family peptidyl-tRNA hydrolase
MFRNSKVAQATPEWLVVGLGNPGPEYRGSRHNLGFDVVELLAQENRIKLDKAKFQARMGIGLIRGRVVALVKPLTFMNLSGRSVAPLARHFGIKPERILVISDDTDLVPGRIRLKPQGTAGGHNGHKSIIQALGTIEYPRLKIGIGRVSREGTVEHVLSGFSPQERETIDLAIRRSASVVETLVEVGLEAALNQANTPP